MQPKPKISDISPIQGTRQRTARSSTLSRMAVWLEEARRRREELQKKIADAKTFIETAQAEYAELEAMVTQADKLKERFDRKPEAAVAKPPLTRYGIPMSADLAA